MFYFAFKNYEYLGKDTNEENLVNKFGKDITVVNEQFILNDCLECNRLYECDNMWADGGEEQYIECLGDKLRHMEENKV